MQQPEPQSRAYESLLHDIEKGLVKIPQFQREFVWSREKSAALIDSILRGYPIGTFIFWRTREQLRTVREIGKAKLPPTPKGEYANQVLDGQQRLTSLFATIRGLTVDRADGTTDDFGNICVNLAASDDDPLVFVAKEEPDPTMTIRVVDLVTKGFTFFATYPQQHQAIIERLQQRLKSYLFSVVLVTDQPIDVATEIFTRINEGGKALTPFEIMVAKTYVDGKFDLAERCEALEEELSDAEFETIPHTVFLQVAAAVLRSNCQKKTVLGLPRKEFVDAWPGVEDAIRHAVDYVKSAFRIPASRLLPYPAMIVPIALWFHSKKGVKPTAGIDADRLRSLFWRIGLDGSYSFASETAIGQDIRRVRQIIDGEAPSYDAPAPVFTADDLEQNGVFRTGNAFIRTVLCVLAAKQPESFDDGSQVVLDNDWLIQANSKNYHHFFPKAFLRKQGVDSAKANHIANITIIDDRLNKKVIRDKPPSQYLKKFEGNKRLASTLKHHLIDLAKDGVLQDDYNTFFINRCRRLARELQQLVAVDDAVP